MKPSLTGRDIDRQGDAKHRRALIVKFGQIGDVVMAIPAVHELYLQGFDIDWVCGRAAKPLLECYSWIKVIRVDDRAILRGTLSQRASNIEKFWNRVAGTRYDLSASLYYARRFRFLTLPIRSRRKITLSKDKRAS